MTSVDESGVGVVRAKKRGRPAKPKAATTTDSEESTAAFNSVNDPSAPLEKKRGRKSLAEAAKEAPSKVLSSGDSNLAVSPSSEKRGRLSTWAYAEYSDASDDEHHEKSTKQQKRTSGTSASRKCGRPRKSAANEVKSDAAVNGAPPRKRGRPSKKGMVGSSLDGEEKGEKMQNGTLKRDNTPTDDSESVNTQKIKSSNDTGDASVNSAPPRKRGRPSKKGMVGSSLDGEEKGEKMHNGTSKRSNTPTDDSESVNTQKFNSSNDTGAVVSEKRRPGRPPGKREKSKSDGKWSSCSTQNGGRFTLPLAVPDSWPTVTNMEEIMKEISEIYGNVKEEKRGEFHSQIKAFVFALLWEDGSFATS